MRYAKILGMFISVDQCKYTSVKVGSSLENDIIFTCRCPQFSFFHLELTLLRREAKMKKGCFPWKCTHLPLKVAHDRQANLLVSSQNKSPPLGQTST